MIITRGKTIFYVDDTITKEVMANVDAASLSVQFIRMYFWFFIWRWQGDDEVLLHRSVKPAHSIVPNIVGVVLIIPIVPNIVWVVLIIPIVPNIVGVVLTIPIVPNIVGVVLTIPPEV